MLQWLCGANVVQVVVHDLGAVAMARYESAFAKGKKEVTRKVDGKTVTAIQFRAVAKYRVANPTFVEKPEGKDTRTAAQKRREVWKQKTGPILEVQKARGRNADDRTNAQIVNELDRWLAELNGESEKPTEAKQTMHQLVTAYVDRREELSEAAGWDTTATLPNNEKVVTRSTVRDYRHTLSYLEANFPKTELSEIKPLDILKWEENQIKAGHSLSRVRKAHVLCKQALDDAVIRGYIEHSCMASLKAPKLGKRDNNALEQADAQKFTAQLDKLDPSSEIVGAMLALHCGLRGGEVCGLQWSCVDLESRHITIRQSVGIANGGKFLKSTKSESGNRVIWIDDFVLAMLKRRKAQTLREREDISIGFDELFIVGNAAGDYLSPTTLSRQFTAISKALGLRGKLGSTTTLHKMRHTFKDALMGGNGLKDNSEVISDVMGHSRSGITGAYGTRDQELMDEAVKAAAEWLRPKKGTKTEATIHELKPAANQ